MTRDEHDIRRERTLEFAREHDAVAVGQAQVDENDVGSAARQLGARTPQRIGRCDTVALARDHPRQHLAGIGIAPSTTRA